MVDSHTDSQSAAGPDRQHLERLRSVTFDPVFIIGDHRSGTTLLYQLLTGTGAFNAVTAYHVINYDEIVDNHLRGRTAEARAALARRFTELGLANRGIDGVAVTPDLPEEYGFIIGRTGRPALTPATLPGLVEVCQKIQLIGDEGRPVLLKNPWDVLTFAYVREAFPQARFIFVHRHPRHVMQSQLAAMRFLFASKSEYLAMLSPWYRRLFDRPLALALTRATGTARFSLGARIVGRHAVKVAKYYDEHMSAMPAARCLTLRYEDICAAPNDAIAGVLQFLDLRAPRPIAPAEVIRPRGVTVLPEVAAQFERIRPGLASYCAAHGY